jgi:hypothetical protein
VRRRNTHKESGAGEGSFSLGDFLAVPGREGSKESGRPWRADKCERVRWDAATCV